MLYMNVLLCTSLPPVLGSHSASFTLLRVLALENVQTVSGTYFGTDFERVIGSLVFLRYLSGRNSKLKIFPWVQNLVLLQTLKLDKSHVFQNPPKSSNILGKLARLQHLYLSDRVLEDLMEMNFKIRFNGLSKLETLENFNTKWCEVKDLPKLTSLQRLRLTVYGSYAELEEMRTCLSGISLPSTSCLRYLALNIEIYGQGMRNNPEIIRKLLQDHKFILQELCIDGVLLELAQLFNQQKLDNIDVSLFHITILNLSNSGLEEDPMPVLEKIPTLMHLHLTNAYVGKEMVCSAIGFPKLSVLKLWHLNNLKKWRVEEGSMPILSHLCILDCSQLEEVPQGLRFLSCLINLELCDMPSKFCNRVRVVKGEQGPDFYKVSHIPHIDIPAKLPPIDFFRGF